MATFSPSCLDTSGVVECCTFFFEPFCLWVRLNFSMSSFINVITNQVIKVQLSLFALAEFAFFSDELLRAIIAF